MKGSPELGAGSSCDWNGRGERSPTSWEGGSVYFPFNGDLYAETNRFSQLTGLPAGLLTSSVYFQPMNLLMKMAFT